MALDLAKLTRKQLDNYRKNAERIVKKNKEQSLVIEAQNELTKYELEIASRKMRNLHPAIGLSDEYKWMYKDNLCDRASKLLHKGEVIAEIQQIKMHRKLKPGRDQYTAQIMGEKLDGVYDDIEVARVEISKEIARRLDESK